MITMMWKISCRYIKSFEMLYDYSADETIEICCRTDLMVMFVKAIFY